MRKDDSLGLDDVSLELDDVSLGLDDVLQFDRFARESQRQPSGTITGLAKLLKLRPDNLSKLIERMEAALQTVLVARMPTGADADGRLITTLTEAYAEDAPRVRRPRNFRRTVILTQDGELWASFCGLVAGYHELITRVIKAKDRRFSLRGGAARTKQKFLSVLAAEADKIRWLGDEVEIGIAANRLSVLINESAEDHVKRARHEDFRRLVAEDQRDPDDEDPTWLPQQR